MAIEKRTRLRCDSSQPLSRLRGVCTSRGKEPDLLFGNLLMRGCLDYKVALNTPEWDGPRRLPVALRHDWPRGGNRGEAVSIFVRNCCHVINCLVDDSLSCCLAPVSIDYP